jgi:hypothetical protein
MVYTIKSLAEFIQRRALGGDPNNDAQVRYQEIAYAVFLSLNALLKLEYFQSMSTPDDERGWNPQFIFSYFANVQTDKDRDEKYIDIPMAYVDLPNSSGILEIRLTKNSTKALIPVPALSRSLTDGVPAAHLEGHGGFYPEGERVYIFGCDVPGRLLVKLAVATGDTLRIDPAIARAVIDDVLPKFLKENPQDKVIDENKQPQ